MSKKIILVLAATAGLLLTAAAPALARAEARAGTADPVTYGELLALVGENRTAADPSDDLTYTGVALWRLVGKIDDKKPRGFDVKLATTAPGYTVMIEGVDGFTATHTSAEVATIEDTLIVADRVNAMALSLGGASIKDPMTADGYAFWKPNWPLRLVAAGAGIPSSGMPGGVARISIEPATAPAVVVTGGSR